MSWTKTLHGSHQRAAEFQRWQYWLWRRVYCACAMGDHIKDGERHGIADTGYCLDNGGAP